MRAPLMRALLLFLDVPLVWTLPAAQAQAAPKPCPRQFVEKSDVARLFIRSDEDGSTELVACVKRT